MLKKIQNFLLDEEGATAVEYGLILGIIAVVIVTAFAGGGKALGDIFTKTKDTLVSASTR